MPTLRHHQVSGRHVSHVGQSCKYLDKVLARALSLYVIENIYQRIHTLRTYNKKNKKILKVWLCSCALNLGG